MCSFGHPCYALVIVEEVTAGHRCKCKANQVFAQDLWAPRGHDAMMASLRTAQAKKKMGKALAEVPEGAGQGGTHGEKV